MWRVKLKQDEVLTNAMERTALEVQRLATLADPLFTGAESTEVFRGFGSLAKETQNNTAWLAISNLDVKENLIVDGLTVCIFC